MDSHASHMTQSSSSGSSHASSSMEVLFFNSQSTPLYSSAWQPSSTGAYAGTCMFLIFLAIIFRFLFAGKHVLESRWLDKAKERRYIKVEGIPTEAEKIDGSSESEYGTLLSPRGEERVRVVRNNVRPVLPWRLSVDLPRALYTTVTAGVAYLL